MRCSIVDTGSVTPQDCHDLILLFDVEKAAISGEGLKIRLRPGEERRLRASGQYDQRGRSE
jgi:hypothetical protein